MLLAVILVVVGILFPTTTLAIQEATVSITDAILPTGDTGSVVLSISGAAEPVSCVDVVVSYDPAVVKVTGASGSNFNSLVTNIGNDHTHLVAFVTSATGLTGTIKVADITLKRLGGESALTLNVITLKGDNDNPIPFTVVNGRVAAAPPTPTPTPTPQLTGEGNITSQGGVVTTEDGRVTLSFPQGAVEGDSTVTVQPISCNTAPEGFRLGNTCFSITLLTTDGVPISVLGADVEVCVEYTDDDIAAAGGDPHLLKLAYYDETSSKWVVLDTTVNTSLGVVCAHTNHLSSWAILALTPGVSVPWWVWLIIALGVIAIVAELIVIIRRRLVKRPAAQVKKG